VILFIVIGYQFHDELVAVDEGLPPNESPMLTALLMVGYVVFCTFVVGLAGWIYKAYSKPKS